VAVLDITEPKQPVVVQNLAVTDAGTGYELSFLPASPGARYVAFQPETAIGVSGLVGVSPTTLGDPEDPHNRANYVIITPAILRPAADELAAYRKADKLAGFVATLEDIYDEFNHGRPSPRAVQEFLKATQSWKVQPQYLVLLGDGTYDYRDLGRNGDNLTPPLLVHTRYGWFTSDSAYGDTDGDGRPNLIVGRLSGRTVAELQAQVAKIQAYEAQPLRLPKQALLVADRPDQAGDFAADTEVLADLLGSGFVSTRVLAGDLALEETRGQLLAGLNAGVDLFNYVGHGGLSRLGSAGYLTSADVAALANGQRLPIMLAMSCVVGQYSTPGFDCLAEDLVGAPDTGAIAFWGPTGLSSNADARLMNQRFMRVLGKTNKNTRLGSLLNQAIDGYLRVDKRSMSPWIYNLLGDPALKLTFKP
jgi:hypothetical protein